jgi:hypothetical protein
MSRSIPHFNFSTLIGSPISPVTISEVRTKYPPLKIGIRIKDFHSIAEASPFQLYGYRVPVFKVLSARWTRTAAHKHGLAKLAFICPIPTLNSHIVHFIQVSICLFREME